MKHIIDVAAATAVASMGVSVLAAADASSGLPRSTPEEQGIASREILAFVQAADARIDALHGLMLLRHGHVVAEGWWEPYAPETRHSLYSLSKSFTSTAVGLAVAEGRMSLDDRVMDRFPDETPADPSDNLKAMRVRDLLRMSTGHQTEPSNEGETDWARAFLAHPVPHKPGTHFLYNTPATYMLSAMVQKATGMTLLDYLRPRLFEPLGIAEPVWGTCPRGVTLGGYGLSIRTEDIARFGQLYLQNGLWGGRQLLPAAWIAEATARQTANGSHPASDWDQGYGYQFWRCRHGLYRADGAFGQYCIVMPEQDAVVAITSGVRDMQAVMNLVWDHLLPAMRAAPLPADEAAQLELSRALAGLRLPSPSGAVHSPRASEICANRYIFDVDGRLADALALEEDADGCAVLAVESGGAIHRLRCAHDQWSQGRLALGTFPEQPAAAAGAWIAEDTFAAKIVFTETPYILSLELRWAGDALFMDAEYNVAFGPTRLPQQLGRRE